MEGSVALEENEEDGGEEGEVGAVGVPEGAEGEGVEGLVLGGQGGAEADVEEGDGGPMGRLVDDSQVWKHSALTKR